MERFDSDLLFVHDYFNVCLYCHHMNLFVAQLY